LSTSLKSVLDVSVRKHNPQGDAVRAWSVRIMLTGCARHGYANSLSRTGVSSVQPGIQLNAYGAMGRYIEQGNFNSDAWFAIPGKPPSLVMFRVEGGASVVVRARESRVHGEGKQ
jgi:hypothetical protein